MNPSHAAAAATFAAVWIGLYTGHTLADHFVQTDAQARGKGGVGWHGRLACARHVATLTATKGLALAAVAVLLRLPLTGAAVAAGFAVDAASHYVIDRRTPLIRLAAATGKKDWLASDPQALYRLDQAAHRLFLAAAALIIAAG